MDEDTDVKIRADHIDEDVSASFDPTNRRATAQNLQDQELSPAGNTLADQAEAFANDPNNSVRQQEENPATSVNHKTDFAPQQPQNSPSKNLMGNFTGFFKRNKAVVGLVSSVGISGTILSSFFGPASMIINLMENFSIKNDTTSTSMQRRFLKVLTNASTQDPICTSTKITLKCKMGTVSNKSIQRLQSRGVTAMANGVPIEPKSGFGYPEKKPTEYRIDLRDGSSPKTIAVENLEGFLARPENRKLAASILGIKGAFNLRVKSWAGKYITEKFFSKFGIAKSGGLAKLASSIGGKIADKLRAFRDKIPGAQKMAQAAESIKTRLGEHMGKLKKGGVAYFLSVATCVMMKLPRFIAAGVAAVQLAQIIPVVMDLVLSPGAMAKASGDASGFTSDGMDTVGTALTEKTPEEGTGKLTSALDSPYLLAAMGVNTAKTPPSPKFSPGFAMLTNPIVQGTAKAEKATKPVCDMLLNPITMYTAMAADAAVTIAASATIIGGLVKIFASWAISELVSKIIEAALSESVKKIFTELATNKDIPEAKGKALGDVLGTGAVAFFGAGGMSRSMPVISKKRLAEADTIRNVALEQERDMAVATLSPFDTSSQYTFLGSIVHNMQFAMLASGHYNDSLFSVASNIVNLPQMAVAAAMPTASAEGDNGTLMHTCDYAASYGLDTGDPATTPAINFAGVPCTSLTQGQVDMSVEEAQELMISEGWLDENVSISMSDSISDLLNKGYLRKDTPLYDTITTCSNPETGDYIFASSGCIPPESADEKLSSLPGVCGEETVTDKDGQTTTKNSCATTPQGETMKGFTAVKNPRSLMAMNVFLTDYQSVSILQGEDDGPATSGAPGYTPGTGEAPVTGPLPGSTSSGSGWRLQSGMDYSGYSCPASSPEASQSLLTAHGIPSGTPIYKSPATGTTLRLCELDGKLVASVLAPRVLAVKADYKAAYNDGTEISVGAGFRTYEEQAALYAKNCGSGTCSTITAKPGTSNHELGLAVDWDMTKNGVQVGDFCYSSRASSCPSQNGWVFLSGTGGQKYGWIQYSKEAWHFSMDGG